jgi:hypothetical protein
MRKLLFENHLSRFVITLRRGEPLHRMIDQVLLKILKTLPPEILRPTRLWLAKLLGVKLPQQLMR